MQRFVTHTSSLALLVAQVPLPVGGMQAAFLGKADSKAGGAANGNDNADTANHTARSSHQDAPQGPLCSHAPLQQPLLGGSQASQHINSGAKTLFHVGDVAEKCSKCMDCVCSVVTMPKRAVESVAPAMQVMGSACQHFFHAYGDLYHKLEKISPGCGACFACCNCACAVGVGSQIFTNPACGALGTALGKDCAALASCNTSIIQSCGNVVNSGLGAASCCAGHPFSTAAMVCCPTCACGAGAGYVLSEFFKDAYRKLTEGDRIGAAVDTNLGSFQTAVMTENGGKTMLFRAQIGGANPTQMTWNSQPMVAQEDDIY